MEEAHHTSYTMHPGSSKMCKDLKGTFWWNNIKREIAQFVAHWLNCQQVKAEHQRLAVLLQPLPILKQKWENIAMDFVFGFPQISKGFDSVWVVINRLTIAT